MGYRDKRHRAEYQREKIRRAKNYVNQRKLASGCIRCGYKKYPEVLEFHHRDSSLKDENIARLVLTNPSLNKIDREIARCDVLCANCHREVHIEAGTMGPGHNGNGVVEASSQIEIFEGGDA